MEFKGEVVYMNLEGGFWGLKSAEEDYFPINLPEQLKQNNLIVHCTIELLEDYMSFVNWGIPCQITAFKT